MNHRWNTKKGGARPDREGPTLSLSSVPLDQGLALAIS